MVISDLREHPLSLSACFIQHGCGHGIGTWQKRSLSLPATPPLYTVLRLAPPVCARKTSPWRASGFVVFLFDASAGIFLLEHPPAIVAFIDAPPHCSTSFRNIVLRNF